MPFSKWLAKLTKSKVPSNAVWFNIIFSAILGIPYLFSDVAFETIVSINTIAASISYFIPIWLRITMARKRFQKGPFHLHIFSIPCGIIACAWILFTSVLFILPTVSYNNYIPIPLNTNTCKTAMACYSLQYEFRHHSICIRDWFSIIGVRFLRSKMVYGSCA